MKTEEISEVLINCTTDPMKHLKFKTPLFRPTTKECDVRTEKAGACKGTKNISAITIPNKDKKPLYLKIRNRGSLQGPENLLAMTKEVIVSGERYQLGTIVLYNRDKHHFTSLQHVNNEFITHDGMYRQKGLSQNSHQRALPLLAQLPQVPLMKSANTSTKHP